MSVYKYFINVFLIYFTSYGIFSLVKFKLFKKIKRWFFFLIGFLLVMIFYEIIKIHPYQSLYFNKQNFTIEFWFWLESTISSGEKTLFEFGPGGFSDNLLCQLLSIVP